MAFETGFQHAESACEKPGQPMAARAEVEKLFSETPLPATAVRNCSDGDTEEALLGIELQGVGIT